MLSFKDGYELYESSSSFNGDETKGVLDRFGDYLAFIKVSNLSFSVSRSLCEATIEDYENIFNNLNN